MGTSKKAFVDSHIFLDYFLDRRDGVRPLGEFAFQFFREACGCKYFVLVCSETIGELCDVLELSEEEVWQKVFHQLNRVNKIETAEFSEAQITEARRLGKARNVPMRDALYAILARDNNAILVSRDRHHTEALSDIIQPFAPEELL